MAGCGQMALSGNADQGRGDHGPKIVPMPPGKVINTAR